jgi:hypothetical protein
MPYEKGGRADKNGNRYEIRWCVYQLLNVIEEKIDYITLEAIGDDEEGVDIWIGHKDGTLEGQQCKGRNASNETWTYGSLNSKRILEKWKTQLDRGNPIQVSLVSPLGFTYLEDLTTRARTTSDDYKLFYEYQIKGSDTKFINFVRNFCKSLGFAYDDPEQAIKMIDYLCRINYRQSPDGERKEIILDKIGLLFNGNEKDIYDFLITWIIDGNMLGKKIGITQINTFLESKNIQPRDLSTDQRIYPRIKALNDEYKALFIPFDSGIIRRKETDVCISQIKEGNSVIIHGMAGSGKSGLTENVITFCENEEIPYLALKLDKRVPRCNVKLWSEYIGLPSSLVHCLHSISKDTNAVIILDQLDGLRWTLPHSREALLVCSELIRLVKHINLERYKKISIIFICRTYDLENDNNIKILFDNANDQEKIWNKIEVNNLTDETVKEIVGNIYDTLTGKLKKLLRLPSNLYIWQQLDRLEDNYECTSTYHLVITWWKQLAKKSFQSGLNESDLNTAKERMVELFEHAGELSALSSQLEINTSTIDFLVSSGFIVKQDIGTISIVSFVHQSLYDCFLAEKMLIRYVQGTNVIEIIGNKENQTPTRRYQMQMFMQSVYEYSEDNFLSIGLQILQTSNVRFSFKFVFLELLNQIGEPTDAVKSFVLKLLNDLILRSHIITNVIQGNPEYIGILREKGILDKWLASNDKNIVFSLIRSIRGKHCHKDVMFIEKYVFDSEDDISQWLRCFPFDVLEDSDDLFGLRMKIYNKYPNQMDLYFDFKSLFKSFEMRALDIIILMYDTKSKNNNRLYRYEEAYIDSDSAFLVQNGFQVLSRLLPLVPLGSDLTIQYSDWNSRSKHNKSIERAIMEIIKKSNIALINQNPELFWSVYNTFMGKGNLLLNELVLDGMKYLPIYYSNRIITYLSNNLNANMFVKGNENHLFYAKELLKKHFKKCAPDIQNRFLHEVIMYFPSDAVDRYKRRIQFNHESNRPPVYWNFWGDFQYEILKSISDNYLNKEALSLKRVLTRKFQKKNTRYRNNGTKAGFIRSPISDKDLSDNSWLKILTSKKLVTRKDRNTWKEVAGGFIENSLEQFSSSLGEATLKEPLRMALLVLRIKENIHDVFVDVLFSSISMSKHLNTVPSEVLEELIKRYPSNNYSYRASSICRIISEHIEKKWSSNIYKTLKDIAINHINPEIDKPVVTTMKDEDMHTVDMLRSNALNCVRGSAARAIGSLLWKDDTVFDEFKDTILALTIDENPAVQHASLYALWPSVNIDKEWAMENIVKLYYRDIRNAAFHNSNKMFFELYEKHKKEILDIIQKCFTSQDPELITIGSYSITEMYIQNNEFEEIMDDISIITEKQAQSIMHMTIQYYEIDKFVNQAKDLILRFDDCDYDLELPITRLLYDNLIDMERDKEFLHKVLKSKFSKKIAYAFNEYLEKSAEPIVFFSDLIFELSCSVINNSDNQMDYSGAEDEISKLIIGLYDETCGLEDQSMKNIATRCLDIWDLMFEKQIGSARKLSFELMKR